MRTADNLLNKLAVHESGNIRKYSRNHEFQNKFCKNSLKAFTICPERKKYRGFNILVIKFLFFVQN